MGNGCTKINENIYFRCRKEAAIYDERLSSRESAADLLGVSVSSLADYELGNTKVVPVDKVNLMADLYNAPQLRTSYCKHDCPLGDCMTVATEIFGLDTIVLRLLNNLEEGKLMEVKKQLINIAASGGISEENVHTIDDIVNNFAERLAPVYAKRGVSVPKKPVFDDGEDDGKAQGDEVKKPPKKPKKKADDGDGKKKYAEFVSMTEEEYKALVERVGSEAAAKKCIEALDNYKGSSGKTYKSDYRAILNWVIERVKKEHRELFTNEKPPADDGDGNPLQKYCASALNSYASTICQSAGIL